MTRRGLSRRAGLETASRSLVAQPYTSVVDLEKGVRAGRRKRKDALAAAAPFSLHHSGCSSPQLSKTTTAFLGSPPELSFPRDRPAGTQSDCRTPRATSSKAGSTTAQGSEHSRGCSGIDRIDRTAGISWTNVEDPRPRSPSLPPPRRALLLGHLERGDCAPAKVLNAWRGEVLALPTGCARMSLDLPLLIEKVVCSSRRSSFDTRGALLSSVSLLSALCTGSTYD